LAAAIDIFDLFPALAAIGQAQLQLYCNEWLRRPIAREFGFHQLVVDNRLQLHVPARQATQLTGLSAIVYDAPSYVASLPAEFALRDISSAS
jgi:hypothetical protein